MCKILNVSRSSIYYKSVVRKNDSDLENKVTSIFEKSRNNYGARKIVKCLSMFGYIVSRQKVREIMKSYNLVSTYTAKKYKNYKSKCNDEKVNNVLNREFSVGKKRNVIVSDLTYVNVCGKWNYVCFLVNIFNREIIGYAAGKNKTAELVKEAFSSVQTSLKKFQLFHTDRGSEFNNQKIDEILTAFNITRSLSKKGNPYDNSVAEATFKILKTELIKNKKFDSLDDLRLELFDYVNWYNNHRIHGSLNYKTPKGF